jgi:1,4-dihydroxy-2-naphthoate octaprenyltransferase
MEELLSKAAQVLTISLFTHSSIFSSRTLIWSLLLFLLHFSIILMSPSANSSSLSPKDILCFVSFCIYSMCGILFAFSVAYFWVFLFLFISSSVLIVVRYSPPFVLEKTGSGGLLRLLAEGFCWVLLHSVALSDTPGFIVIEYLPVFLVGEAWRLAKELSESAEDIKKKVVTTSILLGKHGCCRMFLLMHVCSWVYCALDMAFDQFRGLPLVIAPWAMQQVRKMRSMDVVTLRHQAFAYYMAFIALTAVGLLGNELFGSFFQ